MRLKVSQRWTEYRKFLGLLNASVLGQVLDFVHAKKELPMRSKKLSLAVLLIVCWSSCAIGQDTSLLSLSAQAVQALNTADDAFNDLTTVQGIVVDIENKKTPTIPGNSWSKLAEKYRNAAISLKQAPLPTDFDKSKYAFSPQDLQNCTSRQKSLDKAGGYIAELQAAGPRGEAEIRRLNGELERLEKARKALEYLISVHGKLIAVPLYGDTFKWDWFALNTDVSSSLSDLDSAVKEQKQRIQTELKKLPPSIANLRSNVSLLNGMTCGLAGSWSGTVTTKDETVPVSIQFNQSGNVFTASGSFDNTPSTFSNILFTGGRSLSFHVVADGNAQFSGTLSPDSSTLSGSFTSDEVGSGSWVLHKQ
jgi:hypothetical protein